MNENLLPVLIILGGTLIATVNFMFPFAMSSLMIITSVVVAYSVIKANE